MTAIEYLDQAPPGWFILDVMRRGDPQRPFRRGRPSNHWVALMTDVDPDTDDFKCFRRPTRSCWVRIPGKPRNRDLAWEVLEAMMATRH